MSILELFCSVDDFWQQFAPHWHQDLLTAGQRQRVIPAAERLGDEAGGQQIQAGAAIFRWHGGAEEALRADLGESRRDHG